MKILKNIPVPPKQEFKPLLKMEIGDCVEFTNETKWKSAHGYLYMQSNFKLRKKTISKEPFLGRLWRVE